MPDTIRRPVLTTLQRLLGSGGGGVVLGGLFGTRPAVEPDHVAAVAILLDADPDAFCIDAAWGIGYLIPILTAGSAFLALDLALPPDVLALFELLVGLLLLWLGARVPRGRDSFALVNHSDLRPAEGSSDERDHGPLGLAGPLLGLGHSHVHWESVTVGVLHGFAGSGGVVVALAAGTLTPSMESASGSDSSQRTSWRWPWVQFSGAGRSSAPADCVPSPASRVSQLAYCSSARSPASLGHCEGSPRAHSSFSPSESLLSESHGGQQPVCWAVSTSDRRSISVATARASEGQTVCSL